MEKLYHNKLKQYIRGRHVAIIGASMEGIATSEFLLNHRIKFTIHDKKPASKLDRTIQSLQKRGVKLYLGKDYLESIRPDSIVFRTPGMPLWHPYLIELRKKRCKISSHTKLFFYLCPCRIIGVTGTKGKGTTATLIYKLLRKANYDVQIGGNIGKPPLKFIRKLTDKSLVILELSSFQLEDLYRSPEIAVILMVTREHLATASPDSLNYHRKINDYLFAKANIIQHQKRKDIAIVNADYKNSLWFRQFNHGKSYFFSKTRRVQGAYLVEDKKIGKQNIVLQVNQKHKFIYNIEQAILPGLHNRENMMAAALTAFLLGVSSSDIQNILLSFRGLEHRLEFVRMINGVQYFNDSFSTTPETAIAAIRAFRQPIVLIAGGSEKGSDFTQLGDVIAESLVKTVILIGDMSKRIKHAMIQSQAQTEIVDMDAAFMKNIVSMAQKHATEGDVVILSPACASFDMFKNYKERGDLFKKEVYAIS